MVKSLIFLQIYSRICHIFTYRYGRKRFSPKFAVADTRRAPLPSALEGCGTQSNQRLYGLYLGEITHFRLSFLKLFYFRFSRWRNLKFFEIPDLVIFTIENQQKLRFWPKFGFRHRKIEKTYWKKKFLQKVLIFYFINIFYSQPLKVSLRNSWYITHSHDFRPKKHRFCTKVEFCHARLHMHDSSSSTELTTGSWLSK